MAKKIKRKPSSGEYVDPNLEVVDEDRAFEIELDEELNEIVLVHHYRRKWGDEFDADVEHGLNMDEARALVGALVTLMEVIDQKMKAELVEKATPIPVEGNPLKNNTVQ
mgnify:CR=1 FL=1